MNKMIRRPICLIPLILVLAACGSKGGSAGGHNGITFAMDQDDVEELGFVCQDSEPDSWHSATCKHMSMTGRAFNHNTEKYSVLIGRSNGKVSQIGAQLSDADSLPEYIQLTSEIKDFYQKEIHSQIDEDHGMGIWENNKKERVRLMYLAGVRMIMPASISVSFWSENRPWKN